MFFLVNLDRVNMSKGKSIAPWDLVNYLSSSMSSKAMTQLTDFTTAKLIEEDLVTKSHVYQFALQKSSSSTSVKNSASKFRTIMSAALKKAIPYIEQTTVEFFETRAIELDRFNGPKIYSMAIQTPVEYRDEEFEAEVINLKGSALKHKASYYLASSVTLQKTIYNNYPLTKLLTRYIRKINYLARKAELPIYAAIGGQLTWNQLQYDEILKNKDINGQSIPIGLKYEIHFSILDTAVVDSGLSSGLNKAKAAGGIEYEAFLANPHYWQRSVYFNSLGSDEKKYISLAKVFFYLKDCMSVLTSLSRKAYYEPRAFGQ